MRLLIVRHGDPNYENDCLTPEGREEAILLARRLEKEKIDFAYVSPLGRAAETAGYTLRAKGMAGETMPWLREFHVPAFVFPHEPQVRDRCWDWLPQDWTTEPMFYDPKLWRNQERMEQYEVGREYDWVCNGFDELLSRHGYEREGSLYRVTHSNHDTIALFCHLGLSCVLLSHLWGVSPMPLWHSLCMPTSSVTVLYSEERTEGYATFRANAVGDTSHLFAGGREPSFSGRFCECFTDPTRHES